MNTKNITPNDIITFWLDAGKQKWWQKSDDFDAEIDRRFGELTRSVAKGECDHWCDTAEGAIALILVLDQFTRNLNRNSPAAFGNDAKALETARKAFSMEFDKEIDEPLKAFFYLPFMHNETIEAQEMCVALIQANKCYSSLPSALDHLEIIQRFGRFPHRNSILGRPSSPAEIAFLEAGGFAG